jgi:Tfp pilus assembly protein PilO
VVVVLLAVFLLVIPKSSEVSAANERLATLQQEGDALESQVAALEQAQEGAPEAKEVIRKAEQKVPPVADEPGLILALQQAAAAAAVDVAQMAPGTPVFNPQTSLSEIQVSISVTGTYFSITEFLYNVETLPRAAKVLNLSISPTGSQSFGSPSLSAQATVAAYTSDASAGPGSVPGPTSPDEVPSEA